MLAGDGEAALGTIKMHPYYAWACMYVRTETCDRAENFPRWTCMLFFGLFLLLVVQKSMIQCADLNLSGKDVLA